MRKSATIGRRLLGWAGMVLMVGLVVGCATGGQGGEGGGGETVTLRLSHQ